MSLCDGSAVKIECTNLEKKLGVMIDSGLTFVEHIVTKLPAEPWRQEERCVRAGENESPHRLSSAVSSVYSTHSNTHFDTMRSI